ncbi:MAG: AbrB/MazE/SpoVT family DNA-binding domain-containing protein [Rhodanobacter sp.]|jgi:AbrB family looped-hinge helix DNA binding protein|nr:AbrB/MazE/SpoVT family DNA-binding domain-containing protein [Rhodanobacter sp.]
MRITSKGQVTIPRDIRKALGIVPSSEVEFVSEGGRIWLRKCKPDAVRGRELVERMRGRATVRLSTEEIMQLTRGSEV